jgi:large subunit ribosomal protein L12
MNYIYATLLLNQAGKKVNEANLKKVLESAGIKPEASKMKALLAALEGVDIKEVISKSASVSVAAPAPAGEAKPSKEEEEEEEEVSVEEAAAGLGALFG